MFARFKLQLQRFRIFVNRRAQGRLLLRFLGYWLVYHFVLIHTLLIFDFVRARIELMNSGINIPFGELYSTFWAKYYPLAISALLLLPFLLYDVVKSTHRIVGPLVRFENIFKKLQAGERIENVKLRKNDLLDDFARAFNGFLGFYNQQQDEQKNSQSAPISAAEEQLLVEVEALRQEAADSVQEPVNTPTIPSRT